MRPSDREFVRQRLKRRGRAAGDDQIGPGPRQHAGKMLPQPAARAGHHRHAVGKIEWFSHACSSVYARRRTQHNFQQPRLAGVQPLEPPRPFVERRDRRDQRRDANRAAGDQLDRPRILARRGQRSDQRQLARDDGLQRQRHLGREISHEPDLPAAAHATDRRRQRLRGPDDFHGDVDAAPARSLQHRGHGVAFRRVERSPSRPSSAASRSRSSSKSMAITSSQPAIFSA